MTVTRNAIRNACAIVAIFGNRYALNMHVQTRLAVLEHCTWQPEDPRRDELTAEGWALAKESRLWKAHEFLTAQGFRLSTTAKQRQRFISYVHPDEAGREAWTGNHGAAFWHLPRAERVGSGYENKAFGNG